MSPSDGRRRAAGESPVTEPAAETAAAGAADNGRDGVGVEQRDPWFEPGPKLPAGNSGDDIGSEASETARGNGIDHADIGSTTAEWFLPTGRAGLSPDFVTVAAEAEDEDDTRSGSGHQRTTTSGAPPWAGESAGPAPATPPPWETGPWPGPRSSRRGRQSEQGMSGASSAQQDAGRNGAGRLGGGSPGGGQQQPPGGLGSPRAILVAGFLPLVIPGLVLGALGLGRSSAGEPTRRASLTAIYTSLIWAVIIAVIVVVSGSGGPSGSCSYPAAVHQAYVRAMDDLGGSTTASAQAADLRAAVSKANAAAAATGQIPVRSALFALADDLEQARSDVVAGKSVPAALRQRLTTDGTALTRACPG
jgi:hypothetical protein